MARINITIDVTEAERKLIKEGAMLAGFRGYSPWIRSVMLQTAKKLIKDKEV